jgi:hypothetical protein
LNGIYPYWLIEWRSFHMNFKPIFSLAALAVSFITAPASRAQSSLGTLDGLTQLREGKLLHFSSHELSGGNADFRTIQPGQSLTLLDYKGAGSVRRWWLTVAPRDNRELQRQLIIRCWWDDESAPSVEVPLSDFFGVGFGEWHQFISLPLNMTSGGYNCYWPMPFQRHARITVENRSTTRCDSFYYNVDLETSRRAPRTPLYFHAQFRRARTQRGRPYTILNASGRGHYVGTLLSMQNLRGRGIEFLEGDERVFVDGEREPSVIGTGTEDYFSSGWYFDTGPYSAPYHGLTIKDTDRGRISTYRWHIEDPIPFRNNLLFTIEHGGHNDGPVSDYSSVAFWYQTHPHAPFPPLPADLMPATPDPIPHQAGIIEGEALLPSARVIQVDGATAPPAETQQMGEYDDQWSGLEQLWWRANAVGQRLTLKLPVATAGVYELIGYWARANDYGDVRVLVNGAARETIVRGYGLGVTRSAPISFGRVALNAGDNEITLQVVGKDARSTNYLVGLDGFVLRP